jgi:Major intrinsic protein
MSRENKKNDDSAARNSILEALSYDFTPNDCSRTALFAEFISLALFVWIGCGTAISTQAFVAFDPDTPLDNNMLLSIAMAFGWGIVVLAYSIAPISGKKVILSSHILLSEMLQMDKRASISHYLFNNAIFSFIFLVLR